MKRPRYSVGTMKLRGEPRVYYAVDNDAPQFTYPNSRYASAPFTTAKAAEAECLRLNITNVKSLFVKKIQNR